MLAPQGFELEWGYGSKHPGIFAVKDGKTFFLPSSNTPKRPTDQVRHMQRKCHLLLQGQWRPH